MKIYRKINEKMIIIPSFKEFEINEYHSKWSNIAKIAGSDTPVEGDPVFTDDEKNYDEVQKKIDEDLKGYEKHMKAAEEKMKEWTEKAKTQKGSKGTLDFYDKATKARELAFEIVKEAAKFMKTYNSLYKGLREDLIGTDHVKVAKAILKLDEIYPNKLINDAGKLKRMKRMKLDSQFIKDVLKWTDLIAKNYENLIKGGKILGKTKNQILGAKKQSMAQQLRWGMY